MLNILPENVASGHFDYVVIGSGFGSAFFLHELLRRRPGRILLLEWGRHNPIDWQVKHQANSPIPDDSTYTSNSDKPWNYTIGLGGGTNCWFAQTPRLHPSDFRLKSLYGVGVDWHLSYDDLEEAYCDAEDIMSISGDFDMAQVMPRSRPFPQPPHRMPLPDRMMVSATALPYAARLDVWLKCQGMRSSMRGLEGVPPATPPCHHVSADTIKKSGDVPCPKPSSSAPRAASASAWCGSSPGAATGLPKPGGLVWKELR